MKTLELETDVAAGSGSVHRLVRLLDLFCCAGGAGEGYRLAGFSVLGVDNRPQPKNPHQFVLHADANAENQATASAKPDSAFAPPPFA